MACFRRRVSQKRNEAFKTKNPPAMKVDIRHLKVVQNGIKIKKVGKINMEMYGYQI